MTKESKKSDHGETVVEPSTDKTEDAEKKTCFIIMPIADHTEYSPGHFDRVYEHIIAPACTKAGFRPDRADDAKHTHVILLNILKRLLNADMALCDLSSKNPNVMYELGIRQAFDKPVALIKDDKTERIFDVGILSDFEYKSDLRIDNVQEAVEAIAVRLEMTYSKKADHDNSLIHLMKIQPAGLPEPTHVSPDTTVILDSLEILGRRLAALEPLTGTQRSPLPPPVPLSLDQDEAVIIRTDALLIWFPNQECDVDRIVKFFKQQLSVSSVRKVVDLQSTKIAFSFRELTSIPTTFLHKIASMFEVREMRYSIDKRVIKARML